MRRVSTDSEAGLHPRGTFSGRVAVVVGAGSGLGRAVAKAFARQGASIVVADFDGPRMDRTVDEIMRLGTSEAAIAIPTDVRSDASVRSLARDSIKAMGRADILVNAAGVLLQGRLEKISGADWTWMLETNLVGAIRTSTAFVPHMAGRGSGHIVNVVSFGGLRPSDPMGAPYDTSHAALAFFTERLAQQVRGTGVTASIFCPGSRGPRIGQNTRSRGVGRLFRGPDNGPDPSQQQEQVAASLLEGMEEGRFLTFADPSDRPAGDAPWAGLDAARISS